MNKRITDEKFFTATANTLAVALLGKVLVRKTEDAECRYLIAETECYMGVEDTACHAARKNPQCARPLWERGGTLYVRLIYGLHFMLNVVAGKSGDPMGVLIRGAVKINWDNNKIVNKNTVDAGRHMGARVCICDVSKTNVNADIKGPGNLARALRIDKDFNREDLLLSDRIWVEDAGQTPDFTTAPRVGIGYAKKCDRERLWRFLAYDYFKKANIITRK